LLAIGGEVLQDLRRCCVNHNGHFIFGFEVPQRLQRSGGQGFEHGVDREGEIKHQHYGEWKLVLAHLGDLLPDPILVELKVLFAQGIHRPTGLFLQHLGVNLNQLHVSANDRVVGEVL